MVRHCRHAWEVDKLPLKLQRTHVHLAYNVDVSMTRIINVRMNAWRETNNAKFNTHSHARCVVICRRCCVDRLLKLSLWLWLWSLRVNSDRPSLLVTPCYKILHTTPHPNPTTQKSRRIEKHSTANWWPLVTVPVPVMMTIACRSTIRDFPRRKTLQV